MKRSTIRWVMVTFGAVLLLAALGGGLIWWKISTLKKTLLADLGRAIGARVEVTSLGINFTQGELRAAGISLVNQKSSAPWEKGEISQAIVGFHLKDIFAPQLPVSVQVSSWSVILRTRPESGNLPLADNLTVTPSQAPRDASPDRLQVTQISARDGSVEINDGTGRKAVFRGVSFEASNNGAQVWTTQVLATSVSAGAFDAGAMSVKIVGEEKKITFSDLRLQCSGGSLNGDGAVSLGEDHATEFDLKAVDIPVTMLVAVEWQMKLSGQASGDMHYVGSNAGASAKGRISVNHGKLNVVPWLGRLTMMVGGQDISDLEVDKETTNYEWKDHVLHLTNLDIRKNDAARLAGTVDIDAQGQVDGHIKLGLPSAVTAKWPQMQAQVFPVQLEDFNWSEVHLTGTPDHLQEDLTPRLVSAGLGQGNDLINQATKKAVDLFNNFFSK